MPETNAATVTLVQLQGLAALAPAAPAPAPRPRPPQNDQKRDLGRLDVAAYLNHYGIEFTVKDAPGRALYRLSHCLFDPAHRKNEAAVVQDSEGMLTYQCFHDSCKGWTWKDAREKISGQDTIARFCEGYQEGRRRGRDGGNESLPPDAGDNGHGPGRFYLNKKFCPKLLADEILAEHDFLSVPDISLFRYNGQFYERWHEGNVHKLAVEKLDKAARWAMISDACKQAITRSTIPPGQDLNPYAGEIICLKNGMLNLNTKQLLPHDRKYLSTIQVQASFDPAARCPRWMQFWEETLGDIQKIKILQEWTGYCLTKDTSHHKALFLVGPGQDGKSTYLKILEQLIGQDARSNVTLRELENEFHRVTLFGKLLNVSTETEFSEALTSDFFKAIVSGDGITAAHKNKPVFSFYPFCKLAFGMNRLPRARDYSFGFYRRLIIIRFTRQFLGPSEDKTLPSKLTAEIDGILNWALVGLDRLWDQGGFTESDDVKKILREYQIENNPVLAFIEEKCTLKERYGGRPPEIEKQQLFNMYKEFCVEHNFRPVGASYFFRQIKDLFPAVKDERRRDGSGRKIYLVGIGAAPIGAEDVGDGN